MMHDMMIAANYRNTASRGNRERGPLGSLNAVFHLQAVRRYDLYVSSLLHFLQLDS
jgi:hypothetical protein